MCFQKWQNVCKTIVGCNNFIHALPMFRPAPQLGVAQDFFAIACKFLRCKYLFRTANFSEISSTARTRPARARARARWHSPSQTPPGVAHHPSRLGALPPRIGESAVGCRALPPRVPADGPALDDLARLGDALGGDDLLEQAQWMVTDLSAASQISPKFLASLRDRKF